MEEKRSRTAILDKTSSIDEVNFSKVNDISQIAEQQLKRFDQSYKQSDALTHYQKLKSEIFESEPVKEIDNVAYELEIAEPEFMPTLREKQVAVQKKSASVVLNLRGKLILAVTSSILVLLSILLIYNAVLIKSYNADIANSQSVLYNEQIKFEELTNELNELLKDLTPGDLNMSGFLQNQIVNSLYSLQGAAESYSVPTNWFDSLCNFFAAIFGG